MRLRKLLLVPFALLLTLGFTNAFAQDTPAPKPTLVVYSSVAQLLSGDVTVGITIPEIQDELSAFPPTWRVLGVGTTTQVGRNGELIPDGTVSAMHFWWADPTSPTQSAIVDLAAATKVASATEAAGSTPAPTIDFEPEFPLIALSVADPAEAQTFEAHDVPNLHDWIVATLKNTNITLAGLHITGEFGAVKTTVGFNLPTTGIPPSSFSADYFHPVNYDAPAAWVMNGFYVGDPAMQPILSRPGVPVHLHGYQPDTMRGGHIASAVVTDAELTVYPLADVVQLRQDEATMEATASS